MNLIIGKAIILLTLTLSLARQSSYGQTSRLDSADKELTSLFGKIFPFYYGNNDSLNYYSKLFTATFTAFIEKNSTTVNYQFKSLTDSNACHIVTSTDGLFRIYSWDTWLGGTMHDFNNIFQFKSGNIIKATDLNRNEDRQGSYFIDIFTLKTKSKIYYLAVGNGSYSTRDAYETINVYTICNDTLNDKEKLFKTTTGLSTSISFDYDFFSVADKRERPIHLIKYDADKKIIYMPVVLENGKVIEEYILYQFNGRYFEKV